MLWRALDDRFKAVDAANAAISKLEQQTQTRRPADPQTRRHANMMTPSADLKRKIIRAPFEARCDKERCDFRRRLL